MTAPILSRPLITLLTDFGLADNFAGVLKGVIKSICPKADIVDISHGIEPQNVLAGAIAWQTAVRYFPPETIHLAVIDPGVGTARLAIAAQTRDATFICPDNGLLTFVAKEQAIHRMVCIENPAYRLSASRTFHGRDVFAPAAAHLAAGVSFKALGPEFKDFVRLPLTLPAVDDDLAIAHVVYFDTFGNAYTDLTEDAFEAWSPDVVEIKVAGRIVDGPVSAYAAVEEGRPLALFASHGRLEIAVRNGSARSTLGLSIGDEVHLRRR